MSVSGRLSGVPLDLDPSEVCRLGATKAPGGFPDIKVLAGGRRQAIVRYPNGFGGVGVT